MLSLRGELARPLRSAQTGRLIFHYALRLDRRLFETIWQADLTTAEALEGVEFAFDRLVEFRCEAFLVDRSRSALDWSDLVPLLVFEQYPRAIAAGLRWKASIVAPNPMDALAHYKLHQHLDSVLHTGRFQDIAPARAWLLEKLGVEEGR